MCLEPGPASSVEEHSLHKIFVHKGTVVRYSPQDFFFSDAISFRFVSNFAQMFDENFHHKNGQETITQPT